MKYLKRFREAVEYFNLHGDDPADIEKVTRDKYHEYDSVDGITYELSLNGDDRIVHISDIEHTPENTFYQDQIERYMEYIEDGGILQSFPVSASRKADNLEEMLEYLSDADDGIDIVWDLFKKNSYTSQDFVENNTMYELWKDYSSICLYPEDFGFDTIEDVDLKKIKTISDLHEVYFNPNDRKPDEDDEWEVEQWELWEDKYDPEILRGLEDIIKYFESEEEYRLLDFNHRFAAVKELGKQRVYVEIMR